MDDIVQIEPHCIRVWVASSTRDIPWHVLEYLEQEPGFTIVVSSIDEFACRAGDRHRPDVLLLDGMHHSPFESGSLEAIRNRAGSARVLVLLDQVNKHTAVDILENGFHGFLLRTSPAESFSRAIRAVCRGDIWMPRALLVRALESSRNSGLAATRQVAPPGTNVRSLTARERQILAQLKKGLSNKEIAHELGVVEETVKKHLHHVYKKLGVHRRASVLAGEAPA